MADEGLVEQKIYAERAAKAEALKQRGINPYGNGFAPANTATESYPKTSAIIWLGR